MRARLLLQPLEGRIAPANFIVNNTQDTDISTNTVPAGSLRAAINSANADATADTITFDSTVFGTAKTITLTASQLNITNPVTITGPGAALLTVNAAGTGRVFNINNGDANSRAAVTIFGMTITGGAVAGANGAGIYMASENVTLDSVVITGNQASGAGPGQGFANGGGVAIGNNGILSVTNSTITGNTTSATGGGIYTGTGAANTLGTFTLSVVNSTISGNVADSAGSTDTRGGGGIYFNGAVGAGGFTVRNSTISGNSGTSGGGIFFRNLSGPSPNIQNTTIALNTATSNSTATGAGGGGMASQGGSVNINVTSSIVAGNTAPNAPAQRRDLSCAGDGVFNATFSAIGSDTGPFVLASPHVNDLGFGATLDLGTLANNGGTTQTIALGANSRAVNGGSNPANLANDQRGQARVQSFAADMGSVEGNGTGPVALGTTTDINNASSQPYQFTVTYFDATGINTSSIGTGDVQVSGPNGFTATPTLVGTSGPATATVATYQFTPPGGSWDQGDNGTYNISLQANEVMNTAATPVAVPNGPVGSFIVIFPLNLVVTNTNDAGAGSLRQAILDTNIAGTIDTITFSPTVFNTPQMISLTSGELLVSDNTTITGPGATLLTVRHDPGTAAAFRVFDVNGVGTKNVTISGMTISGGNSTGIGDGGGLFLSDENLTLDSVVMTGNNSGANQGGAIGISTNGSATGKFLTILNSTISGNTSTVGGAIYFGYNGALSVQNSTISGNISTGEGGGIYFYGNIRAAGFTVTNSTISGNNATTNGGGICLNTVTGAVLIQNSTIAGNTAGGTGGGISQSSGTTANITVVSTIVSGNSSASPDIFSGNAVNVNNSAIGNASGFTLSGTSGSNLAFGANLQLGALANNGGPTQTIALGATSPAINAGSNPANLQFDQRGTPNNRVVGAAADIGAFEVQPTGTGANVVSTIVNAGQANLTQRSIVTSVTVTFNKVVTFVGQQSAAFQLARTGPGGTTGNVTLAVDLTGSTATQTIAKLTFSGTLTDGSAATPSLVDGNYTLTVFSNQITGGINGGDSTSTLFRLFGDVNGDKTVNLTDLTAFRNAFGTSSTDANYRSFLDFNGDGQINLTDLTQFRNRFGIILP
jgi:hypothetical protein